MISQDVIFYKEGEWAVLLQLEEGKSANVKFLET